MEIEPYELRYARIDEYTSAIDCEFTLYRGSVLLWRCWIWGEEMTKVFDTRELRLLASQCLVNEVRYDA